MRWMFIGILILFLFLIGFGVQSVFADYFKTLGVYHKINPIVCIMYPDEKLTDIEMISNLTHSSIDEWETKLVNATNGNWKIFILEYEWSKHKDKSVSDYPYCTIFIFVCKAGSEYCYTEGPSSYESV